MGYRSQVRSVIYGDSEKICALVAKHALVSSGGANPFKEFADSIRRYRMSVRVYDQEATAAQGPDTAGGRTPQFKQVPFEVIDLSGDSWKWYDSYPDVQAWEALLDEASEMGLHTEFVRIGEETDDIEIRQNLQDDWIEALLGVSSTIVDDVPDDIEMVTFDDAQAA